MRFLLTKINQTIRYQQEQIERQFVLYWQLEWLICNDQSKNINKNLYFNISSIIYFILKYFYEIVLIT